MAETADIATRPCPECGLELRPGVHECPSCGCAPGGTALVDHLPSADADNRLAAPALLVAGLVAAEAALAVISPVAAAVVGGVALAGLAARALSRH